MKRFILVFIAINALLTVSAIEPQRIYHAVAGAVQDTVLTIPAIPNSISSVLELRMEFPDRRFLRKQSGNIVFSWRDCNNRLWTADFALSTSGTDEILDNTYLSLRVNSDENEVPVSENKYYDIVTDINSEISLCLGMTGNEIVFIAGQNTLKAFETVCGCFNPASPIEIKISGKIEISSLVTEFQKDMKGELSTGLNREEIINMTGNYPQPAGIWKALDRDTDSRQALAGGRYTLAIVPAEDK
ncbi:MAG: hypothetical protein K2H84_09655, partial [Paramuribaculum sp.]|nr:hypothetical protein [Paramuribaculum sp.]